MSDYHLAQVNIARILYPINDPRMDGFTSKLAEINAIADNDPDFVWRLQDTEGDATSFHIFEDNMMLINYSIWKTIDSLFNYTYKSAHTEIMKDRKLWFSRMDKPYIVLWWIPAGTIPSLEEVKEKLELLQTQGSTQEAFTFKKRFAPPA